MARPPFEPASYRCLLEALRSSHAYGYASHWAATGATAAPPAADPGGSWAKRFLRFVWKVAGWPVLYPEGLFETCPCSANGRLERV
jgi:hypothetical protein